uniref:Uncharacterized protein n=1 Tax=Cucumis sativus TaxID=3659 RepID=A0A0A0L4J3_CUCSA
MQIGVRFERFDDTLNLLDQASSQGIELDVVIINTIMHKACEKVRIDVIAFVVEPRKDSARPSDVPLSLPFNLGGYHSTTMELEAMQVHVYLMQRRRRLS